jgi:PAS domain-containing protein
MENTEKTKEQFLIEIDQLKTKVAELEKSEAGLKQAEVVLENLPVGYNLFDMEGKVISVNNIARGYFGVSEDDPLTDYRFFDDPSISDETKKKVRHGQMAIEERYIDYHAIKNHKMYESTKSIQDKLFIRLVYKPYGPIGNPLGLIVIIQDFTESKLAEEELKNSEFLLKESQTIANIGSYDLDPSSGVWRSSSVLNNIFGIDEKYKKDITGWLNIIHPDDQAMMLDYFQINVLTNKERFNKEYRILRISDKEERCGSATFDRTVS